MQQARSSHGFVYSYIVCEPPDLVSSQHKLSTLCNSSSSRWTQHNSKTTGTVGCFSLIHIDCEGQACSTFKWHSCLGGMKQTLSLHTSLWSGAVHNYTQARCSVFVRCQSGSAGIAVGLCSLSAPSFFILANVYEQIASILNNFKNSFYTRIVLSTIISKFQPEFECKLNSKDRPTKTLLYKKTSSPWK